jgi:hypothetical protein
VVRINRSEPKFAAIRDLLTHRAHDLAHGLQPIEAFVVAAGHDCGHGDHLSGAPTVVAYGQQVGNLYGRRGLHGHDDHVLEHSVLLPTEPRIGLDPAARGTVLSSRYDPFGGQVLERRWGRVERKSPRRSRPSDDRKSSLLGVAHWDLGAESPIAATDLEAGAGRGNRTPTGLLGPADFKSSASASFALIINNLRIIL